MRLKGLIASPIVLAVLICARLLIVSNYNTDTAVTLFRLGGVTDTLVGTTLPLLPQIMPLFILLLLALRNFRLASIMAAVALLIVDTRLGHSVTIQSLWDSGNRTKQLVADLISIPLSRIGLHLWQGHVLIWKNIFMGGSWFPYLLTAGALIALFGYKVDFELGTVSRSPLSFTCGVNAVVAVLLTTTGYYILTDAYALGDPLNSAKSAAGRFWQPPERVWLANGKSEVAYPLGIKDGWFVLLAQDTRLIQYIRPDSLKARRVCRLGPLPTPPNPEYKVQANVAVADPGACYPLDDRRRTRRSM